MLLGAFTDQRKGESGQEASIRYDLQVGFDGAYTRHYVGLDQPLNGSFMTWGASHDKTQVIGLHSRINKNVGVLWREVADGLFDAQLNQRADELKSYPGYAYLVWHHEPENDATAWWVPGGPDQDKPSGEPADYVAAGLHVRKVFRDAGCGPDRALFGQCLMAGTYGNGHGGYDQWALPFGVLAVDGYDRTATKTFEEMFTNAHNVATSLGKPLFVEETGVAEDPADPQYKPNWFAEASACAWPELVGVEYSNVTAKADYRIDTSPESLAAYKAWAASAQ